MICSTAMSAAALSSLILGSLMCILVVICRKYGRDPDNIAPAIASCLGDLFTLVLTGVVSNLLIPFLHTPIPLMLAIAVVCFGAGCLTYTLKSDVVRHLLKEGWSPLFIAMCISIGTGIVLDTFVSRYEGFAILAIVISGTSVLSLFSASHVSFRPSRGSRVHFGLSTFDSVACCSSCREANPSFLFQSVQAFGTQSCVDYNDTSGRYLARGGHIFGRP